MVKVTLDLTEHELEIFSHCIESAIDVKHMNEQEKKTAKIILEKLNKHLINPRVCGR
jgi:hypothetical protein